jgi:hypothetical protein
MSDRPTFIAPSTHSSLPTNGYHLPVVRTQLENGFVAFLNNLIISVSAGFELIISSNLDVFSEV